MSISQSFSKNDLAFFSNDFISKMPTFLSSFLSSLRQDSYRRVGLCKAGFKFFSIGIYLWGAQECCFLWSRIIEKSRDRKMGNTDLWTLLREPGDNFKSANFCNNSEQFVKNWEEELAVNLLFPFMFPVTEF